MGAPDLYDVAAEFLDAVEQAVTTSPGGAIGRAYVSPGLPSIDCPPEISVYVGNALEAGTTPVAPPLSVGLRDWSTARVNLVALTAVVSRCVPVINGTKFPSPASMSAASRLTTGDLWAVWNVVPAMYRAREVFTRPDGERLQLFWDGAVPLAISGGAGGWAIPVRVELDGYGPVAP